MALKIKTFYWLPYCSTCQKAEAYLKDMGAVIERYVDVKTEPVAIQTLQQLASQLGGVEALFSKRAIKYRTLGLNEKTLTDTEMLDYMHSEYTFIKRPVLETADGKVLAGFSKKAYDALK